jgi:adenylate kinase
MKKTSNKKSDPFNLILLGDPGAGKATQGVRLVKKYPFLREFDFGQWLRGLKTPAARRKYHVETRTNRGILAPADLARKMFRKVILETPSHKGVFFNGNPKMVSEAKTMIKAFKDTGRNDPLFIYLYIPQTEMLKRIQGRKGQFRSDDEAQHLRNRMEYYKEHIRPTISVLKERYGLRQVDGVGTQQEVFRRLVAEIEKFRAESGQ